MNPYDKLNISTKQKEIIEDHCEVMNETLCVLHSMLKENTCTQTILEGSLQKVEKHYLKIINSIQLKSKGLNEKIEHQSQINKKMKK